MDRDGMNGRKPNWIKVYAVCVSVLAMLLLAAFGYLYYHTIYTAGRVPQAAAADTDWAVVSWNNTLAKLDYDSDVVFFGDSITCISDFREYFPDLKIVNLGYCGDTLAGMIGRIPAAAAVTPEKVFVLGGINGLTDSNVDECISTYGELIDQMIEQMPHSELYIQSVLPISAEQEQIICHNTTIASFNQKLERLAEEKGAVFIDLFSLYESNGVMEPGLTMDGLHIFPETYDRWAEKIAQYLD